MRREVTGIRDAAGTVDHVSERSAAQAIVDARATVETVLMWVPYFDTVPT